MHCTQPKKVVPLLSHNAQSLINLTCSDHWIRHNAEAYGLDYRKGRNYADAAESVQEHNVVTRRPGNLKGLRRPLDAL